MDSGWTPLITGLGLAIIQLVNLKLTKETKTIAVDTHTLVNSNMGIQLEISAVALRRIAVLTGNDVDEALATKAENALKAHMERQAVVDSGTAQK